MKTRIIFLKESYSDIEDIFTYIKLDSPQNTSLAKDRFLSAISNLADFPYVGKPFKHEFCFRLDYRMLIINKYITFYRVIDQEVYIYRILYGTSDYINILEGKQKPSS